MSTIVKGILDHYDYKQKYDDDGNEYKEYTLTVNGKKYTAKVKPDVFLSEKNDLVMEVNEGFEAISGFSPKDEYKWGNASALKKHISSTDRYEFIEGIMIEKRKEVNTRFNSANGSSRRRVTYTIVFADKTFSATGNLGEKFKPGMLIAAVLRKGDAILTMDKGSGKIYGSSKPWYIVFIITIIAFNMVMNYMKKSGQEDIFSNYSTVLIVGNIFFFLAILISLITNVTTNKAKRFLLNRITK